MWAHGFRYCFTPLPGCFSPFPHGTGPLSVTGECLGLEGGPPSFPPGFTCPAVLGHRSAVAEASRTGLSPCVAGPPRPFLALGPRSLATTRGISFDFSSSGYLDVSVPRVASCRPMRSAGGGGVWPPPGSPIRRSAGRRASAPHRGLSQLATSFIGFLCQGIHRVPLTSSRKDVSGLHTLLDSK